MSSYNADSLDQLGKEFDKSELSKILNSVMLEYGRIALLTSTEEIDHKKVASHLHDLKIIKDTLCNNDDEL